MLLLVLPLVFACSVAAVSPSGTTGHVVLITPPFFGHMIPLLDFAKRLSVHHRVTYIVSASKVDVLKRRGLLINNSNHDSSQSPIDVIGLFDQNDDEYEVANTTGLAHVESVLNRMSEPLRQLLFPDVTTSCSTLSLATHSIRRPIDLIIADVFVFPPVREAYERNIAAYFFVPNSLMFYVRCVNMSRGYLENSVLGRGFAQRMLNTLSLAKGLICNSVKQLDSQILTELRRSSLLDSNLTVHFVAPLMLDELGRTQNAYTIDYVKQWLDTQWKMANQSPSVIYVAFGSLASFKPDQLIQIADALAPYTFIWSLKAKFHVHVSSSLINNRQHLLLDWAPQRFILSHVAVRLFVSHGGWNSLLENMLAGKPVLVWPLFGDQIVNGYRLQHEFGMGQCIHNASLTGGQQLVSSDQLRQYLNDMLDQETEYARKARQVQQMVLQAKENSSRVDFEEIIKVIDDQARTHTTTHSEL